ncbi:MAG: formate dehydrogenase accessory sulfurtransferase FdhD [Pyrinomonadaceae bacterium]|nr:formate dehydrogenase accessory sulfurtransferase FdhD [Pyrinomonadaceae bacterium]
MSKASVVIRAKKLETQIESFSGKEANISRSDFLAVEEPLEIRLGYEENGKPVHKAISITMRTPENDFELATGFLFTEGILQTKEQVSGIKHCGKFPNNQNTVRIDLKSGLTLNLKKLERNFYTTSSCGVCGKSSLEALATGAKPIKSTDVPTVSAEVIDKLPEKLRTAQTVFDETGGLHAAALFDTEGRLLFLQEDVGRHNALDKLIGEQFLKGNLPLDDKILFLSGRASFELVQKAVMAQIPIVAAVSAPSSLAVQAAEEFGITLLGFVRDHRFNIYTGKERIEPKNGIE